MSTIVLLDTGPLGMFTNPGGNPKNAICRQRVQDLIVNGTQVRVPEIAYYEERRKLAHLQLKHPDAKRLSRFQTAVDALALIQLNTDSFIMASELWAQSRHSGHSTAGDKAIDGDVILVAQAVIELRKGYSVKIATSNTKDLIHFQNLVGIIDWDDLKK